MSAQDLRKLVRDLENSDPRSGGEQEKLCERIRGFQTMMERAQARELAGYLDTAALLTDYLRVMGGIGPEEVRSIVVRLVKQVEEAFTPQVDRPSAAAQPSDARGDDSWSEHGAGLDADDLGLKLGAELGGLSLSGEAPQSGGAPPMGPGSMLSPDRSSVGGKFLGEILLQLGYVKPEDIDRALLVQRATGIRMGEALVNIGATTYERIKTALGVQERLSKGIAGPPGRASSGPASGPPRPLSF